MGFLRTPRNPKTHIIGTPVTSTDVQVSPDEQVHLRSVLGRVAFETSSPKPWVKVSCRTTPTLETYTVVLPGGRVSVEILKNAKVGTVRTTGYLYAEERVSPTEARYRFLRAVVGSMQESGQIGPYQFRELLAAVDRAAAPLLQS